MRSASTSSTTRMACRHLIAATARRSGSRTRSQSGASAGRSSSAITSASWTSKAICTCCRAPTAHMSAGWRPTAVSRRRSRYKSRAACYGNPRRGWSTRSLRSSRPMLPTIALVGRPNVGKSTLFNRLTKTRNALVADIPGLTRDRHYGRGRAGDREFLCVDTGGFEPVATSGILFEMAKQAKAAIAESDAIVFLVDARAGLAPQDRDIAELLRKSGRPIVLAVNKAEGLPPERTVAEFHELGLGEPLPISAAHGENVRDLIDIALAATGARQPDAVDDEPEGERRIRVAVVGRPNVGKSTLVNTLLGEERVIAFDEPGTTRDAIHLAFES